MHRVEDLRRAAGRDIGALGDMRADRQEGRVVAALAIVASMSSTLAFEFELDAHVDDARDLGVEHVARQAVFRDAEAHHAAGHRAGLADRHLMAETAQMIGGGQARRTGADDQHALAARRAAAVERPAFCDRACRRESARPN